MKLGPYKIKSIFVRNLTSRLIIYSINTLLVTTILFGSRVSNATPASSCIQNGGTVQCVSPGISIDWNFDLYRYDVGSSCGPPTLPDVPFICWSEGEAVDVYVLTWYTTGSTVPPPYPVGNWASESGQVCTLGNCYPVYWGDQIRTDIKPYKAPDGSDLLMFRSRYFLCPSGYSYATPLPTSTSLPASPALCAAGGPTYGGSISGDKSIYDLEGGQAVNIPLYIDCINNSSPSTHINDNVQLNFTDDKEHPPSISFTRNPVNTVDKTETIYVVVASNSSMSPGTHNISINGVGQICGIYAPLNLQITTIEKSIELTLNPAPVSNQYVITATPGMPIIQGFAKIVNADPDPTSSTEFTWSANLNVNKSDGAAVTYDSYVIQNTATVGTALYTFTLADPNNFVGGNLTLNVSADIEGEVATASSVSGLKIVGTNPSRATVQSAIDASIAGKSFYGLTSSDVSDAFKRIACQESQQRQFNAAANGGIGPSLISADNGVGMLQITSGEPFDNPNILFDWTDNIAAGVDILRTVVAGEKKYPSALSANLTYKRWIAEVVNPARLMNGLAPIANPTLPAYTTSGPLSQPASAEMYNQLLSDGVRGYNGFAGTLYLPPQEGSAKIYGIGPLREFRPNFEFLQSFPNDELDSLSTNPSAWEVVPVGVRPAGIGDPNYVQNVAGHQAACNE